MRALVLTAYKQFQLQDLPEPALGPHDVMVRVKACGICGSDVHGMDGSTGRRQPPIVMGHEASGIVDRLGPSVTGYRVGDRVTFDSTIYNPHSFFSQRGMINLCDDRRVLGVSCDDYRQNGAFAEFVAVPDHILFALPPGMSFEQAALVEPVSIAVHARNLTPLAKGDAAVVFGAGLIGLMMVQVLKQTVAETIIAVDIDDAKLAIARAVGATHAINSNAGDVAAAVKAVTGGRGADAAFEAVGIEATIRAAISSVRKGGAVTLIGNLAREVSIPLQAVVTRQIRLQGSCASAGEYPECLELIASRKIDVDRFISATAPLSEGADWFDRLYRREPGLMKVVLQPDR
ncbi:MAG TPA: galactitol-1-phosphate 5-dehydrogenase [Polyangia bacterium]|jgi:L-iditol 2-dehydrogenase|nr:galactitol-1-phosphate 5-dehydrogenase [Polyangia bacterium]